MNAIQSWGIAADGSVKNVHPLGLIAHRACCRRSRSPCSPRPIAPAPRAIRARSTSASPASEQDIAGRRDRHRPRRQGPAATASGDYAGASRCTRPPAPPATAPTCRGVAGLPNMPSGAALRLIGGRGTLTTRNPVMTVESYWPYATTLFDYVRRAMPFQSPGSLNAEEIYAVVRLHPGRRQRHRQSHRARRADAAARADAQPRRLYPGSAAGVVQVGPPATWPLAAAAVLHLLPRCRRRGGPRLRTAVRIVAGDVVRFTAVEPEGRHAREHVVPKDQRMHQCGA